MTAGIEVHDGVPVLRNMEPCFGTEQDCFGVITVDCHGRPEIIPVFVTRNCVTVTVKKQMGLPAPKEPPVASESNTIGFIPKGRFEELLRSGSVDVAMNDFDAKRAC